MPEELLTSVVLLSIEVVPIAIAMSLKGIPDVPGESEPRKSLD